MHGNAFEWVEDPWHDSYKDAPLDGSPWVKDGDAGRRVIRGGSWTNDPQDLRAASRGSFPTDFRDFNFGFRLARTLNP
jgi:formylglycine-generating enzyme required for sulfatase activity